MGAARRTWQALLVALVLAAAALSAPRQGGGDGAGSPPTTAQEAGAQEPGDQTGDPEGHVLPEVTSVADRDALLGDFSDDPYTVTLDWMGRFHPLIVHFPIALLLVACFAEIAALFGRREAYGELAYFCLLIGTLGAVVSTILGWAAAEVGRYPTDLEQSLVFHRWFGIGAAVLSATTCWLAARARGPSSTPGRCRLYRSALFLTGLAVGITGHFGASLVFGPDHFG